MDEEQNQVQNDPFEIQESNTGAGEGAQGEQQNGEGGENTNTGGDNKFDIDSLKGKVPDEVLGVLKNQAETIDKLSEDKESLRESVKGLADKNKKETKEKKEYKLKYENIKRSKDLSEEEREEMTDEEIKALDAKAEQQEAVNEAFIAEQKAKEALQEQDKKRLEDDIRKGAMILADNDETIANKIIAEMNKFKGNGSLDSEELERRLKGAYAMIPEFKGTQYQTTVNGGAVDNSGSGVDNIVKEVVADRQNDTKKTFEI